MVDSSKSMENPSRLILEGKEIYLPFTVEKKKASKTGTRNEEATLETWHRRMGHQGAETIKKLEATVNGMKITDLSHTKCEVCSETKMAKKPFTSSTTRVSKPLQLIHSDVAGPMRTATAEKGHCYIINEIDDYSQHTVVYTMDRKSDALNRFKKYIAKYGKPQQLICEQPGQDENHSEQPKGLRTDGRENTPPKNSNVFARVTGFSRKL